MGLLVVGSIGLDDIKTPAGISERVLGGSAVYAAASARHFTRVHLMGPVGYDLDLNHFKIMENVVVKVDVNPDKTTLRWHAEFDSMRSEARTLKTDIGAMLAYKPILSKQLMHSSYVLLANCSPNMQFEILDQLKKPKVVALDTKDFWIQNKDTRIILEDILGRVDIVFLNEAELFLFSPEQSIFQAVMPILDMGCKVVIVKRSDSGAVCFIKEHPPLCVPAYLAADLVDPTGCGDAFAGGVMGYIAKVGVRRIDLLKRSTLKQAMLSGSAAASFAISHFGPKGLLDTSHSKIRERAIHVKLQAE